MGIRTKRLLASIFLFGIVALVHMSYYLFVVFPNAASVTSFNSPFFSTYFETGIWMLSISYGLAIGFTTYSIMTCKELPKCGVIGVAGGVTLSGIIYAVACFFLGCCGSPMLLVYVNLFGSSALGLRKPLVLIITTVSVCIGYIWLEKKIASCPDCTDKGKS